MGVLLLSHKVALYSLIHLFNYENWNTRMFLEKVLEKKKHRNPEESFRNK